MRAVAWSARKSAPDPLHPQAAPVLEVRSTGRTDGHVTLVWGPAEADASPAAEFELQAAADTAFATAREVYVGPDRASFRSGLPAGVHHFRVRQRSVDDAEGWSPWSEHVAVEIAPYSLASAWSLFGIGALLVASILAFLVSARRSLREGGERA